MWEPDCAGARAALDEQGVWFCDDAVSEETAAALRREILAAHQAHLLTPSGHVLAVRSGERGRCGTKQEKPHIYEADIVEGEVGDNVLANCPVLAELLGNEGDLRQKINDELPELSLERLESGKVQVNEGSCGAFPYHFDLSCQKGSRRALTAILYLNPEWQPGDGGEVELLPFPFADVVVPPVDRRLVVFAANTVMHRVRPFSGAAGRVCVNLWFDGEVALPFPKPLPPEDYKSRATNVVGILRRQPQELRAFCKVWYRDAITASFREAFRPSTSLEAAMALHVEEAGEVESRISAATLDMLRECVPFESKVMTQEPESADLGGLFDDL